MHSDGESSVDNTWNAAQDHRPLAAEPHLSRPVLLIGGMTMGWFTPTEAAVAAVLWSLFLGLVRYRTMTFKTLAKASFDTIETTASVLFIVTAASIFAWLLTVSQAAQLFSDFMFGMTDNWWTFLIIVNILLLIVGAFLDTIAAISILVPILMPAYASSVSPSRYRAGKRRWRCPAGQAERGQAKDPAR